MSVCSPGNDIIKLELFSRQYGSLGRGGWFSFSKKALTLWVDSLQMDFSFPICSIVQIMNNKRPKVLLDSFHPRFSGIQI